MTTETVPNDRSTAVSEAVVDGGGDAKIPALTGVRAVAAYLVFFHHVPLKMLVFGKFDIFQSLHIGVTLFFVLSGFLIALRYRHQSEISVHWLRRYFQNRFARIYPVYFLLAVATLLVAGAASPRLGLVSVTLTQGLSERWKFAGIPQAWTLTVEECFYASAPLIFLLARGGLIRPFLVGCGVLGITLGLTHLAWFSSAIGNAEFIFIYTFVGRFAEFFVGIWVAGRIQRSRVADRLPGSRFTIAGCCAIAASVIALSAIGAAIGDFGVRHPAGLLINNFLLPAGVGLLYYGLVTERSWLRRALSTPLMQLLGKSSYVFYLIHNGPLTNWVLAIPGYVGRRLLGTFIGHALNGIVHLPLVRFGVTVYVAILLYKHVEAPLNRYFRGLGRPVRARSVS